ncbi:MAG: LabA-like NYN domain-containing protein [Candidatus Hodarchaeales archaeon]|jgi:uncharacterized LabA/DUF88 family protein
MKSSKSITTNRVGLFIDGGNFYHAAKKLQFKVDFLRLRNYFVPPGKELFQAFYYTAFDSNQPFIMKIMDWLRYNDFVVISKQVKFFSESSMKGNLDVELVVDMMINISNYDIAILFSGDGDFTRCVAEIQKNGKRVHVVSTEITNPSLIAQELKNQADEFIELADIIPNIEQVENDK